jgi:hypothetical protein
MRRRAILVAALLSGCITPQPPPEPDLAPRPAPKSAAKPPTPELPTMAECEISAEVTRPKGVKGELHAWVTDGECWREGTHAWGETKGGAVNDRFFVEVYVPQGTQLWVCAALVDGKKPITVYGQLDRAPLLGKGAGEVAFMGLKIALAKGKRVSAPPPQPHH